MKSEGKVAVHACPPTSRPSPIKQPSHNSKNFSNLSNNLPRINTIPRIYSPISPSTRFPFAPATWFIEVACTCTANLHVRHHG